MAISEKYSRTYHFPFSPGTTSDDRIQHEYRKHLSAIPQLVHTEKLDGENNCLSRYGVFARSHVAPTTSPWTESIRRYWQMSLDDIRVQMKISPSDKSGNGQVIQAAKEQARVYLRSKQQFVWNATNITRQMREQLISLCLQYEAHITIVYVEVPCRELFRQNIAREAIVPAAVMHRLINKLEIPDLTEAHEVIYQL